jgi:hypothetical protein
MRLYSPRAEFLVSANLKVREGQSFGGSPSCDAMTAALAG